jgi:hypothetical protein
MHGVSDHSVKQEGEREKRGERREGERREICSISHHGCAKQISCDDICIIANKRAEEACHHSNNTDAR